MTGSAVLASVVLVLLAVGTLVARRRHSLHPGPRQLEVTERAHLARDSGMALVRARGEVLLVGWGKEGVRLLARVGRDGPP